MADSVSESVAGGTSGLDPTQWVERHGDALFRYAMLRLRDRSMAEEVVQEAFVAALQAQHRFQGGAAERTWLIGILKHKVVDSLRRVTRRQEVEQGGLSEDAVDAFSARGHWRQRIRAWREAPDAVAQDIEFWAAFEHCLGTLPDSLAATFLLREVDQLSAEEVCHVLDLTSTNLWARLHRARLRLRNCLDTTWFNKTGT